MELELKIAVCDDEKYYREYVVKLLSGYLMNEGITFHIDTFVDGRDFCQREENLSAYDIAFLDIGMENMNGMDTAYAIRRQNSDMDIVFITIMPDYVFEGYKVGAVRYIMKTELDRALPECMADILKKRKYCGRKMEFPFVGGNRQILIREILYIESKAHKLQFARKNDTLYMYGQLNEVEAQLSDNTFVRCHQSYLVNMEHINKINNYLIFLSDGMEIPISRKKYSEVKSRFLRYKENS